MAWPPPALPTNRTNATPQQDTHPADHNAVNLAMNDTVARVITNEGTLNSLVTISNGAIPSGDTIPGGTTTVATVTLPAAGNYLVNYIVTMLSTGALAVNVSLRLAGINQFTNTVRSSLTQTTALITVPVLAQAAGQVVDVQISNLGGAVVSTYADTTAHRLTAIRLH